MRIKPLSPLHAGNAGSEGEGEGGVGEEGADIGEELGALLAVDDAVVDGEG